MAKRKRRTAKRSTIDVGIVIPVYGQPDLLAETIDGLTKQTTRLKISVVLVDDKSPDYGKGMADVYDRLPPESIHVIYNKVNRGFAYSCNRGATWLKRYHPAALLFLNSDVVLHENAVEMMYNTLIGDDSIPLSPLDPAGSDTVGVVAPLLVFPDDTGDGTRPGGMVQHAGMFFDLSGTPQHRLIGWRPDNKAVRKPVAMQAVSGACLMTRAATWKDVIEMQSAAGDPSSGGFNEVYGRGTFEDVEYCIAARLSGYRVVYQPKAMGVHHVGASIEGHGGYPMQRNHSIFIARAGNAIVWDEWLLT